MFTKINASAIMSKPVIALDHQETIAAAWEMLRGQPFGHLVIISGSTVIGVIDARSLLAATPPSKAVTRMLEPLAHALKGDTVCVTADSPLDLVVDLMLKHHRDAIPVASPSGKPLGIITTFDILRAVPETGETQNVMPC